MRTTNKFSPVAIALAASGCFTLPSHAMLLTNALTSNTQASVEGGTPTQSSLSNAVSVNTSANTSTPTGSSQGTSSSWGNSNGVYRADAYGYGVFNAGGQFLRALTITNNTASTEIYSLPVFLYGGAMYSSVGALGGASYSINISSGSQTLFSSAASVSSSGVFSQSGTVLNNASVTGGGIGYNWDATTFSLDLGALAPTQSMTINFSLAANAFGNNATPNVGLNIECGASDAVRFAAICALPPNVRVGFGDPSNPNATSTGGLGIPTAAPGPTGPPAPAPIPAPLPLGLIGVGILAAAFATRGISQK